jgi:hypothetical protein
MSSTRLVTVFALALLASPSLVGCGTETDDRPATRAYIVSAILTPSCANGGCHSSATAVSGYSFGTLEEASKAFQRLVVPGSPNQSRLVSVLIANGGTRMPLDSPLPDDDIALIEAWIQGGAQ